MAKKNTTRTRNFVNVNNNPQPQAVNHISFDLNLVLLDQISDPQAREVIANLPNKLNSADWNSIFTKPISEVKSESFVGIPIKLLARVKSITDQLPVDIGKRVTVIEFSLSDKEGNEIECLRALSSDLGSRLNKLFSEQKQAVFKGSIISVIENTSNKRGKNNVNKYYFLTTSIDERITAEDLIYVRENIRIPRIHYLQNRIVRGTIVEYIKNTLIKELGIKGLQSAKDLDKAIDFMIYQSFSFGKAGNTSLRLHSLVIGSPGSGKKILTNIALALNPVAQEVSAADGKVTMAGMIGNVTTRRGRRFSDPGYLSLASGGVICIQDFHEIRRNRPAVLGSFAKVMEDGEAIDSTSARSVLEAETSIHLDTNKRSQVHTQQFESALEDINIPANVITRFDYIVDIHADAERQWQVVMEMSSVARTLSSFGTASAQNPRLRNLKRIIAYIITNTPKVKIDEELAVYKTAQLDSLKNEYSSKIANIDSWQGLFTRLGISIDKYIKAIAASKFRQNATNEDVDLAITFIRPKLDFIATIKNVKINSLDSSEERIKTIKEKFSGTEVNKNEVHRFLAEKGSSVNLKTVERDLANLEKSGEARKTKRSHWEIGNKQNL